MTCNTVGTRSSLVSHAVRVRTRHPLHAGRPHVGLGRTPADTGSTFATPGPECSTIVSAASSLDLGVSSRAPEAGGRSGVSGRGGRLGRYLLIERVGQGRQADVWRARASGASGEDVALKVISPSGSVRDHRRRAQLRHEAERGARLEGPSLLPTYEYGEADGAAFMAMPLVVGCTLAAILDQRRAMRIGRVIPGAHRLAAAPGARYTREVAGLAARVARAAADAHDGRVAHRDIKPSNILVRRDPADGVYLCDFGLARDLDIATPAQLLDGAGSPLYMAPERLLRQPADEVRADVYALGVTLFEALTLTHPMKVPAQMPSTLWARYLATAEPRRPRSVRPSIPPALEDVIVRATARDPARRHPTAAAFADDLERFLND